MTSDETRRTGGDAPTGEDEEKLTAFMRKAYGDISATLATVMAAIGDRLGLFKALAADGPATSAELAMRAGVNERYAREWLGGMYSAGYLDYNAATERFALPTEHARVLAEEDGPYFFGGMFEMVPALLGPLDELLRACREGGGVAQAAYDEHMWTGQERGNVPWYRHVLVQRALPALPEVRAILERGADVADIGCGRGAALIALAQAFPRSRYAGYDAFVPTIASAAARAAEAGVADRVRFVALDAAQGLPEQYDVITSFDVVHDSADPSGLLRAIHAALRPGGRYVCFEPRSAETLAERVGPRSTFLYGVSMLYCMTTSLSQGGAGLGALGLPESRVRELCAAAGFGAVRRVPLQDVRGEEDRFHSLFEIAG